MTTVRYNEDHCEYQIIDTHTNAILDSCDDLSTAVHLASLYDEDNT
jgi:hypothetical protein